MKNAKEIVKVLEKLPPDRPVMIQRGTDFFKILDSYEAVVLYDEDGGIEYIMPTDWTAEDAGLSEEEWSYIKRHQQRACILVPIQVDQC